MTQALLPGSRAVRYSTAPRKPSQLAAKPNMVPILRDSSPRGTPWKAQGTRLGRVRWILEG